MTVAIFIMFFVAVALFVLVLFAARYNSSPAGRTGRTVGILTAVVELILSIIYFFFIAAFALPGILTDFFFAIWMASGAAGIAYSVVMTAKRRFFWLMVLTSCVGMFILAFGGLLLFVTSM